jgi:hypothetical protein
MARLFLYAVCWTVTAFFGAVSAQETFIRRPLILQTNTSLRGSFINSQRAPAYVGRSTTARAGTTVHSSSKTSTNSTQPGVRLDTKTGKTATSIANPDSTNSDLLNLGLIDEVSQLLASLPLWQTVGEGEPLTLSIGVDVINLVSLQWYFNGQPIAGATHGTLYIASVHSQQVGRYQLRATLLGITLVSIPTDVQINATDDSVDRSMAAFDKLSDAAARFAVQGKRPGPRALSGTVSHGYTGSQTFSTVGATKDPGEPNHCGVVGGASEWYAWQPPTNGTAVVTTDGSTFDTVLAIYIGPGNSYSTLTNVTCDNDSGADGKTSRVTFTARAGTIYYIAVDGVNAASGTVKLSYTVGAAPQIVTQPQSKTVVLGKPATLSVGATAFPAPAFQWSFNGTNLIGATNASLTLNNISAANFGLYRVRVTNNLGSVLSIAADLGPERTLRFVSRVLQSDGFHVGFECPAGTNYVLESSRDFSQWTPRLTNNNGGQFTYIDSSAKTNTYVFYRMRALP